ncbi:hypothetical protein [Campylobacter sp. RM16192]|uniref:hypothetical protein n=1 Tax=Campylobacter sp. RM16192 TaxID=1660080 RepID=UPI001556B7F6|nr:hypothetical protein [Campylobacter sp. RM16192]
MSSDVFKMAGNLRFFNNSHTINLSAVCVSNVSRNLFNNTNMTNLRNKCIEKIKINLQNQINEIFEKGSFDVFKK